MSLELATLSLLNGLSYGLLLFMLSSGLTLIFSMMGVLNFAHASFYMLGAYMACTMAKVVGFWPAAILAPVVVGSLGALFERHLLRRVHRQGHVAELLITFGLSYVILEAVQLTWGRAAVEFLPPEALRGPAFTLVNSATDGLYWVWGAVDPLACVDGVACSPFPATRGFMMLMALCMLMGQWWLLTRTRIGLIIQSALTHPDMVEALGHNVPRILMGVFGAGAALAALAGVVGGSTFVTEPAMAATVGSVIFVVVVIGGLGSLKGAFLASLLIGWMQTFAVSLDHSILSLLNAVGWQVSPLAAGHTLLKMSLSQLAPILPYVCLVMVLIFRPRGLMGTREG
jgi:branched-chain amino acid transport system permease protein